MTGRKLIALFVLAVLTMLLYGRTAGYPFVFDDIHTVTLNPAIRDTAGIPGLFLRTGMGGPADTSGTYRPVLFSTYAIDYAIGGTDPAPYHWTAMLVHIASCFIVFLLIQGLAARAGRDPWPWSLVAAGIFCLHPVQTEAVIYTSARSTLLSTAFCLAALLAYFNYRAKGKSIWLILSLASYASALLTKENSLTFVAMFFLLEAWLCTGTPERKFSWKGVAPFLVTSLSFFALRLHQLSGSTAELPKWGFVTHWLTEVSIIPRYARLLVFPYGLNVDHDMPLVTSPADPYLLAGIIILAASAYFFVRSWKSDRLAAVLIAWPFVCIATEVVFPLQDLMVEYRLYPALAGIVFLAALKVSPPKGRRRNMLWLIPAACLLAVLGATSFERENAWSSDVALWRDAAAKSPSHARAYYNLGDSLNTAGDYRAAEGYILKALRLKPDLAYAYIGLAKSYRGQGLYDKAAAMYEKAIGLYPEDPQAYQDYGSLLGMRGDYAKAEEMLRKALELNPGSDVAYNNLGNVYSATGKLRDSLLMYEEAARLNGRNFKARVNMGVALAELGRPDESFAVLYETARLFPDRNAELSGGVAALKKAGRDDLASSLEQAIGAPPR